MPHIFITLLNMSITASWIILAIILLRLIFKKAPKVIFCFLWILAGLRLVLPFSIESILSLIPSAETIPHNITATNTPEIESGFMYVNQAVNEALYPMYPEPWESVNPMQIVMQIASYVWASGLIVMLLYALISFLKLRKKVSVSIKSEENIYICDYIETPFILGVFRPGIYIPSSMNEEDIPHVIAHEKAHIKRRDYLWKPLGFLILSVYWFNPVIWVAYILLCRDIELACDEKVIKSMEKDEIKAYSVALLNCSVSRHAITACPVAFGETGVKGRIKTVLNYKKPAFWVIVVAIIASIIATVCFMTNPPGMKLTELCSFNPSSAIYCTVTSPEGTYTIADSTIYEMLKEIRIEKTPINESRSESRDKTNSISFAEKMIFNFNADCTHVWVNDGINPSYTYEVKNPESLIEFFDTKLSKSAVAYKSGTETKDVTIKLKNIVLEGDNPYIEVEFINKTGYGFGLDDRLMIYRIEGEKKISCMEPDAIFNESVSVYLPHFTDISKIYSLEYFDLSQPGIYRFEKEYNLEEGQKGKHISGPHTAWIEFEVNTAPDTVTHISSLTDESPVTTGTVFFYKEPTIEYKPPVIKTYGKLYKKDYENFLSSLKKNKWTFDGLTDRINFNFDGKIYCDGWIYFGYEQRIAYYDEYFCTLTASQIKTLKNVQADSSPYSDDSSSVNISGKYEEYVFKNSVDPVEPKLYLQNDEKTFIFSWSVFSSFVVTGTYRWEGDTLILSGDDKIHGYVFEKENDTLVFNAERSSSIPQYKYSGADKSPQTPVPNKAVFEKE